jgi:hypothetical protein
MRVGLTVIGLILRKDEISFALPFDSRNHLRQCLERDWC